MRKVAMKLDIGMVLRSLVVLATTMPALAADPGFGERLREGKRPALTVVISIDQFRADYLTRFADLFLPARQPDGRVGGFRYLMSGGSWFVNARYTHFPTFTCVGHAAMMTGAQPDVSGIVSNRWWDRQARAEVYCVDDDRFRVVGAVASSKAKPMGPLRLRTTTVGDELKLATNGAAKVVTLALKDRAAVLMGGHTQDVSLWFDDAGGRWISSTAFARDGKLPAWAEALNTEAIPDRALGTSWAVSVPEAALARAIPPPLTEQQAHGFGARFPHQVGSEKTASNYFLFSLTPSANAFVFETARRAVTAEKLGQRGAPDLLAVNLSTNDYVGHVFGPYSPEVLEITVQTDRELAGFLGFLDRAVPGGLAEVVIVLTSDHGVAPIPEDLQTRNISAGRVPVNELLGAVEQALTSAFGGGAWVGNGADGKSVGAFVDPNLYLSQAAVEQALASGRAVSREQIEAVAARAVMALPGVYAAYTRSQLEQGRLPDTALSARITHGFHPHVSGDVVVVTAPGFYPGIGGANTSHGSPWAYDVSVPILIAGPGIRPGVWVDPVSPTSIAPTLSLLLGIAAPSGSDGTILEQALRR
jgi:predicted AlkP superfamily pyrophosphatase or phosphodiesterase